MKTLKSIALAAAVLLFAVNGSAQTADEIIGKYVNAIGGKDLLSKITSVSTENMVDVMGMQVPVKVVLLNGKGMRQDVDVQGTTMTTCFNEKEGWTINPMMGSGAPEVMPEAQYNAGKDQIVVGGPFVNYTEKGYKAELVGNEAVGDVNAFKIKLTASDNTSSTYYFDPNNSYLIKSIQQADMQGQSVENITTYSDYKPTEGYSMPYKINTDIGGQFSMAMTVTKVELNKPVDEAVFAKPQ